MRGILYLMPLCVFCLGWSAGTASQFSHVHAPLSSGGTFNQSSQVPSAAATPAPDVTDPESAPPPQSAEAQLYVYWQAFHDAAHGLTIFYPPQWLFFDAAQDLTLPEEIAEPARAAISNLLLQLQSTGPTNSFIGYGFASPQEPSDLLHVNSVVAEVFSSKGLTLHQFGQSAAAQLDRRVGIDVDSFDLVTRLRPHREEAVSIRFRGGVPAQAASQSVLSGTRTAGWQVVLLTPDAESLLVLTFTVLGEQIDELEPLLTEMVRRVQWANDDGRPEPAVGPVAISPRTMQVHAQPAPFSPLIGKVVAGRQYLMVERDFTGNWWRISYGGQPGWVSDKQVAADVPDAPVPAPVAMIERRVNVRSGPGASNPVIGVVVPGQRYIITGKSASGEWWQIDDFGGPGWIFSELVTAFDAGSVQAAVVKFPRPPLLQVTEAVMKINWRMNVRGGPHIGYPIIGSAVPGQQYPITGKNSAGSWWRIDHNGQPGWVFGELVTPVNAGSVQVVARFPLPPLLPDTEAVLTFSRRMNVYSGPSARYPVIDTTLTGYRYPIIGRNAVGSWWQIDNRGQPGWVFGQFVTTVGETENGVIGSR